METTVSTAQGPAGPYAQVSTDHAVWTVVPQWEERKLGTLCSECPVEAVEAATFSVARTDRNPANVTAFSFVCAAHAVDAIGPTDTVAVDVLRRLGTL